MPVRAKKDEKGPYFQCGSRGKHFYYDPGSNKSRNRAREKAKDDCKRLEYFKHRG